jgi:DNA-binding NtrC family response regulator
MNTTKLNASILIVEPNQESLIQLISLIKPVGLNVIIAQTGEQALDMIEKSVPAIILLNCQLPGIDGFETCSRLKQHQATRAVPILLIKAMTESIDYRQILSIGSVGIITKPFQGDELLMHIHVHIAQYQKPDTLLQENEQLKQENKELKQENAQLKQQIKSQQPTKNTLSTAEANSSYHAFAQPPLLIGQSKPIIELLSLIRCVSTSDLSIIIEGECGSGKERVAQAIHNGSAYAKGSFVAVNCSAIPCELAESAFFGAMRGAFTGAVSDHKGYFELAEKGTLFLDEIGEMPCFLQAKLLRALEERTIWPVGASQPKPINIRVIAATNANLLSMIDAGTFRYDLYSRLSDDIITTPPLRAHKEDIASLVEHFLNQLATDTGQTKKQLNQSAFTTLENYDFPGNVRELKSIIKRAWFHCHDKMIQPEHLHLNKNWFAPNGLTSALTAKSQQSLPQTPTDVLESVPAEYPLTPDEQKIFALTQRFGSVNNVLCQKLLGASHDRVKYLLKKMTCNHKLVREGDSRATIYCLGTCMK